MLFFIIPTKVCYLAYTEEAEQEVEGGTIATYKKKLQSVLVPHA